MALLMGEQVVVALGGTAVAVALGEYHTCAIQVKRASIVKGMLGGLGAGQRQKGRRAEPSGIQGYGLGGVDAGK